MQYLTVVIQRAILRIWNLTRFYRGVILFIEMIISIGLEMIREMFEESPD